MGDLGWYARVLKSTQCQCEHAKYEGHALCYPCFKALPVHMQSGLYQQLGDGFEEAYEAAVKWLTEDGNEPI